MALLIGDFILYRTQQTGTGRFDMRFRMVAAQAVRFRMVAAQVVQFLFVGANLHEWYVSSRK